MTYFGLFLSDIRVPQIESSDRLVAWSPNKEDLERLLEREKVTPYKDGLYHKVFRAGGPLEWCHDRRYTIRGGVENFGVFMVITGGGEIAPKIEEILTADEYAQRHREQYVEMMRDVYRADTIDTGVIDDVHYKQLGEGSG